MPKAAVWRSLRRTRSPRLPSSTPPHLAEALAPYAALSKGSPEDVRRRLRAATTTLKRRLDAGLPLRTLVWDRTHERYAVATLVLFREPGGFWWRWDATARRLRRRNRRRRRRGLATPSPAARAVAFFASSTPRAPPPPEDVDAETRAGKAFLKAVQRRRGIDSQAKADHERWLQARRGGAPSAPDDSDSSDDDGTITIRGDNSVIVRIGAAKSVLNSASFSKQHMSRVEAEIQQSS